MDFVSAHTLLNQLRAIDGNMAFSDHYAMWLKPMQCSFTFGPNMDIAHRLEDAKEGKCYNVINVVEVLNTSITTAGIFVAELEKLVDTMDATKIAIAFNNTLLSKDEPFIINMFTKVRFNTDGMLAFADTLLANDLIQQKQFVNTVNGLFNALPEHGHAEAPMLDILALQTLINRCRNFLPSNFALYLLNNKGRCAVTLDENVANSHALEKYPILQDIVYTNRHNLHRLFKPAPEHNNVLVLQDSQIEGFILTFYELMADIKTLMLK